METLNLYQNNVAYDFDMFAPKPDRVKTPVIDYPETQVRDKVNSQRKTKTRTRSFVSVALVVMIIAVLFANIFARAEISQVEMQIRKEKKEISKLDSEIVRLQCSLQSMLSFETLEASALELGMQKLERNQIKYINVSNAEVEAAEPEMAQEE